MLEATKQDISWIADLLARAYDNNPTIESLFAKGSDYEKRFRLFSLMLPELISIRSVYYDESKKGVAVIYESGQKKPFGIKLKTKARLVSFLGVDLSRKALKVRRRIDKHRKQRPHLYFWILAIDPNNKGLEPIQAIRDFSFSLSAKQRLPIYAETPLPRTKALYQRYGFRCYKELDLPAGKLWMMERYA